MTWFAAHLISYVLLKEGKQESYPVMENIVLIEADSSDSAWETAKIIGQENFEVAAAISTMTLDNMPARRVFGGVRKIIECQDVPSNGNSWSEPNFIPHHGTEITYSEMIVEGKENLDKLITGETVNIIYEE